MYNFKAIIGEPQNFSPSKISTFSKCPLQYKLRYIDRIRPKTVMAIETKEGSALHELAENYDGTGDIKAMAAEAFSKHGLLFLPDNVEIAKCILNIKSFKDKLHQDGIVTQNELQVKTSLCESIEVNGIIDACFTDKDGFLNIVDYKTCKSRDDSRYTDQLQLYVYIMSKMRNIPFDQIKAYIYYIRMNVCGDNVVGDPRTMPMYAFEIKNKINKIQTETNWRATPNFMCKYCDYSGTSLCPETCKKKN